MTREEAIELIQKPKEFLHVKNDYLDVYDEGFVADYHMLLYGKVMVTIGRWWSKEDELPNNYVAYSIHRERKLVIANTMDIEELIPILIQMDEELYKQNNE